MTNHGDCENCPLSVCLAAQGGSPVSYRGPLDAPIVVLGQSPAEKDLIVSEPFTGPAGHLVVDTLATVGFDPAQVLFTNVCWCRPTDKLEVDAKSIKACAKNIESVIGAHKRDVIICLGNEAAAAALSLRAIKGSRASCGQVKRSERWDTWTVSSVHPAFVLRSPSWKPEFEMAMRRAYELWQAGEPRQPEVTIVYPENAEKFFDAINSMKSAALEGIIAFDIETDATKTSEHQFRSSYQEDHILGIGFAWREQEAEDVVKVYAMYVPLYHGKDSQPVWEPTDWRLIRQAIKSVLEDKSLKLVGQNLKFDCRNLVHQFGLTINPWFDTMIAHRLLADGKPNSLKFMARFYLNAPDWDIMDKLEAGQHLGHFPIKEVGDYCAYDCAYTILLTELFLDELSDTPFKNLMFHLDMPLFNKLIDVELKGMLVDRDACKEVLQIIEEELQASAQEADIQSGWAGQVLPHKEKRLKNGELSKTCQLGINPSSSKDVGFIMYDHFGLTLPEHMSKQLYDKYTNKDGIVRTDDTTIQYMLGQGIIHDEHPCWPFVKAMLRHRSLKTLRGYVNGVVDCIYPDGRVHTNFGFKQNSVELTSPATGRLSSNNPNMQNVNKILRPCWVADPGYLIIESDYSALEIRIWTFESQDPQLIKALNTGDFHTFTAASAFEVHPDDITKDQRAASKTAIFGMIYGGGSSVLGRAFGWPPARCDAFLERINRTYPQGKAFLDGLVEHCRKHGWVETMFGRRRRLPEIWASDTKVQGEAERQARNSPIQGGASELCSLALIRLTNSPEFGKLGAWVCNNVHDSIVTQAPEEVVDQVVALQEQMMGVPPFPSFNIPLLVETEVSYRWGGDANFEKLRGE